MANALHIAGNRVMIICLTGEGPLRRDVAPEMEVLDLKTSRLSRSVYPLYRIIKKHRDANYVSSLIGPNLLLILMKLLFPMLKVFIREASTPSLETKERLGDRILYPVARRLYNRANNLIAVSKGVSDDLISYFKVRQEKIRLIYNPVVSKSLKIADPRMKDQFTPRQEITLGFLGRVDPVKQIELQIDLLAELVSMGLKARLLIGGPNSDKNYSQYLLNAVKESSLASQVEFLGNVIDIEAFMGQLDILLLTSKYEGLPSVLIEGLMHGKHVISFDCPNGPSEILKGGQFGLLVNPDADPIKYMADAIGNGKLPTYSSDELNRQLAKFSVEEMNIRMHAMCELWSEAS